MGKGKVVRLILLVLVIVICGVCFYFNFKTEEKGLEVTKWDNVYKGNKISLSYEDSQNISNDSNLLKLDSTYKIREMTKECKTQTDVANKCVDILNAIVEHDDVADSSLKDGYSILKEMGKRKKVSSRDMAIISRDILITAGVDARIGEFRKSDPKKESKSSYYVVEYYSTEYDKWVVLDFLDKGIYIYNKVPLSGVELVKNDKSNITYKGNTDSKKHIKDEKEYFSSYTIPIDNTLSMKKSNMYLTYYTDENDISLIKGGAYISPTIYTKTEELFTKSPSDDGSSMKDDEKAYLVLLAKKDKKTSNVTFVVSAVKNEKLLSNYSLKINNKDMEKVEGSYKEIRLQEGTNTIKLSEDGSKIDSSIVIEKKE